MTKLSNFTRDTTYHVLTGNFCRLLITFPNGLDPDQDGQNVGLDLDPNCFILWISLPDFFFFFFLNNNFEKSQQMTTTRNIFQRAELRTNLTNKTI